MIQGFEPLAGYYDWCKMGSIPLLQKYLVIGNRGYKDKVRRRGLGFSLRRQATLREAATASMFV